MTLKMREGGKSVIDEEDSHSEVLWASGLGSGEYS